MAREITKELIDELTKERDELEREIEELTEYVERFDYCCERLRKIYDSLSMTRFARKVTCKHCGKKFMTAKRNVKYCSPECQKRESRHKKDAFGRQLY